MRLRRWFGCFAVLGIMAATAQIVHAQQSDASLLNRLEVQEQRIAELETLLTQRQQPFQMQPASWNYDSMVRRMDALETAIKDEGDKGKGWIDSHEQDWVSTWGGRAMFDYVMVANDNVPGRNISNYAEFRSLRLFAEGYGYGVFDYRLEVDFEPEIGDTDDPAVRVEDAYVAVRDVPFLGRVVMGNQKVPFGLNALARLENITFMERALPVERASAVVPADGDIPLRRVGIAAYNHSVAPRWVVQYGAFFDRINPLTKEYIDDEQGIELVGRAVWLPWYANEGRHLLHLGAGAKYVDDANDLVVFSARPEVHELGPFVSTGALGPVPRVRDYGRINLEAAALVGPLSLQAEFYGTRVEDRGESFYGAYLQAGFFLTGENRGYNAYMGHFDRVQPLENFWLVNTPEGSCIGTGAWEVAARWSYVDYTATPFAFGSGTQNDFTFGLNWYWNPRARMMFNYIHTWNDYNDPGITIVPELDIVALRWQVDF